MNKFFLILLIFTIQKYNVHAELKKYENTEYHFTVGYPFEWIDLSSQLIDELNIDSDGNFKEIAIFQKNNVNINSLPYMQIIAYKAFDLNSGWNDFLAVMNDTVTEMANEYRSLDYIKEYKQISSASSKKDNYFVSNCEYKLSNNQWLHDTSIYFLGKEITIQINILLPKSGWNDFIGTYNEIITSFMFDENYKFIDMKSGILDSDYTMNIQDESYINKVNTRRINRLVGRFIIALIICLIVFISTAFKNKKNKTS